MPTTAACKAGTARETRGAGGRTRVEGMAADAEPKGWNVSAKEDDTVCPRYRPHSVSSHHTATVPNSGGSWVRALGHPKKPVAPGGKKTGVTHTVHPMVVTPVPGQQTPRHSGQEQHMTTPALPQGHSSQMAQHLCRTGGCRRRQGIGGRGGAMKEEPHCQQKRKANNNTSSSRTRPANPNTVPTATTSACFIKLNSKHLSTATEDQAVKGLAAADATATAARTTANISRNVQRQK